MSKRRPWTEAEKQLRREKSLAWQATPEAAVFREQQRQRRIEYNKTKVEERLSPAARKASGERITRINKTRERSSEELAGVSARAKANSGICRNPDFIFGSGTVKTTLLVHGVYWHRDPIQAQAEIDDYQGANWHLFVLWTKRISQWMLPPIKAEVKSWLEEIASSQSRTPVFRQFMTWNADRSITLSPME